MNKVFLPTRKSEKVYPYDIYNQERISKSWLKCHCAQPVCEEIVDTSLVIEDALVDNSQQPITSLLLSIC